MYNSLPLEFTSIYSTLWDAVSASHHYLGYMTVIPNQTLLVLQEKRNMLFYSQSSESLMASGSLRAPSLLERHTQFSNGGLFHGWRSSSQTSQGLLCTLCTLWHPLFVVNTWCCAWLEASLFQILKCDVQTFSFLQNVSKVWIRIGCHVCHKKKAQKRLQQVLSLTQTPDRNVLHACVIYVHCYTWFYNTLGF